MARGRVLFGLSGFHLSASRELPIRVPSGSARGIAYSLRSPGLAGSNQVTEYRERIGLRAYGFDSDIQW